MNKLHKAIVQSSQTSQQAHNKKVQLEETPTYGNSALEMVKATDNLFPLVSDHGLNKQNALHYAIFYKNTTVALAIIERLEAGELFDLVAQQDVDGRNVMHLVILHVNTAVALAIIKKLNNNALLTVLQAQDKQKNNVMHFMLCNYRLFAEKSNDVNITLLNLETIIDSILEKPNMVFRELANQKNEKKRFPGSLPGVVETREQFTDSTIYIIDGKHLIIKIQQKFDNIQKKLRMFFHFDEAYKECVSCEDKFFSYLPHLLLAKLMQEALKSELTRAKFEAFINQANEIIINNPEETMGEKKYYLLGCVLAHIVSQDTSLPLALQEHIKQYNICLAEFQKNDMQLLVRQIPQCLESYPELCKNTKVDERLMKVEFSSKEKGKQPKQNNIFQNMQKYLEDKAKEPQSFFDIQKRLGFREASEKAYAERLVHFYYLYQILNLISQADAQYSGVVDAVKKYIQVREIQYFATKSKTLSTERYTKMLDALVKLSDTELWEQFNTFNQSFNLQKFVDNVNAALQEQSKGKAKQVDRQELQFNIALFGVACFFNQQAVLAVLNSESIAEEQKKIDSQLLNFYVYENDIDMVRILLDRIYGQQETIEQAETYIAECLEQQDKLGNTAWHYLCRHQNIEMAELLINCIKPDRLFESLKKQNDDMNTPLHLICSLSTQIINQSRQQDTGDMAHLAMERKSNSKFWYNPVLDVDSNALVSYINSFINLVSKQIGNENLYTLLGIVNIDEATVVHLLAQVGSSFGLSIQIISGSKFEEFLRQLASCISLQNLHDLMLKKCKIPQIEHYQITNKQEMCNQLKVEFAQWLLVVSFYPPLLPAAILMGSGVAFVSAKDAVDEKFRTWTCFELAEKYSRFEQKQQLNDFYNQIFCFIQLEQYFLKNAENRNKPAFQSKYNAYKNLYEYLKNNIAQARNSKQESDEASGSSQAIENKSAEFNVEYIGEMKSFIKGMLADKNYSGAFSSYVMESEFKTIFTRIADIPDDLFVRVVEDHFARHPSDQRLMTQVENIIENKTKDSSTFGAIRNEQL